MRSAKYTHQRRDANPAAPARALRSGYTRRMGAAPADEDQDEDQDEDDKNKRDGKPRKVEKNYMTPAGYRRLADELEFLRGKKRPEVVSALSDAAAEGDRSENAEYIYRKRQLREIDRRLRFLGKRLDVAVVVDPRNQTRRDRVFFGATVAVEDEDGERHVYRIVGVDEVEVEGSSGAISWRSPIGNSLIGKAVGDTVTVRWHAGTREISVVEIEYP
jgi:transcription elongation factor GreB